MEKELKILYEMSEKRDRHTKHFRTEKNSCVAAVYADPVHYEEDGDWKEIDNTLELKSDEQGHEYYQNKDSRLRVKIASDAGSGSLVAIEKDDYTIAWSLPVVQEPGLVRQTKAVNKAKRFRVIEKAEAPQKKREDYSYSQGAAADELKEVLLTEQTTGLLKEEKAGQAARLQDEQTTGVLEDQKAEQTAEPLKEQKAEEKTELLEDRTAEPEQTKETLEDQIKAQLIQEENQEMLAVTHAEGQGVYEDIMNGIDVQYIIKGETLKENIILKSPKAIGIPITFAISHKGLKIRMEEDKSIVLYQKDQPEKVIYRFAIPFMYDADGAYSDAVHYELKEHGEETLITTVPDENWLREEARAYPVVVDPVAETSKATKDISDTFVREKNPASSIVSSYGSFCVANNSDYGKCRAFLKFNNLPTLDNGSIIYDAKLYVWQYKFSAFGDKSFYITAHKVNAGWSEGTATWNNQPGYDSNALDYALISEVKSGNTVNITPKSFDITKLVRDWYNTGVNNGVMLKLLDESVRSEGIFITSDYPANDMYKITSDLFPSGVFYYRNVNGLEDYQSYHEQNVERAGTGYTNDYNGNVVFIHNDAKTQGNLLPIGISHVYNLSENGTKSRMGYGWRLSVMQELVETGKTDFPYVYTDEDGTKHYFYKDTEDGNKLKDEDGLGLVITMTSSAVLDEYRTIETKEKIKYVFGQDGYLRRIRDLNGNTTSFNYGPNINGNYIGNIIDASGETIIFNYTSDMASLSSITDTAGRKTSFQYDSTGRLTSIQYPDGKISRYTYDGNKLSKVTSYSGYSVEYSYNNDFKVPRVAKITERGGSSAGQVLKISYSNGNTTIFEEPGLDGNIDAASDNKKTTYHFDHTGRPTDVTDSDGYSNSYQYYTQGMKNNKLNKTGSTQKTIYNYVRNPRFDSVHVSYDGWSEYNLTGSTRSSVSKAADEGYLGKTSMKVHKPDAASICAVRQKITLKAGTYTLSAYLKTKDIVDVTESGARIGVITSAGTIMSPQRTFGTTDNQIDGGWERHCVTFTISKEEEISVLGGIFGTTGNAWLDCFQLEAGKAANKFNMISNPGFEYGSGTENYGWKSSHANANDGRVTDPARGYCGGIGGETAYEKYLMQSVNLTGEEGDIYSLSCWVKANAITGKKFRLAAAVLYETGDPKWHEFDCNPNITDWQFVSGTFSTDDENAAAKRKYVAIHIYIFYTNQLNRAYVDGVQLIKDDGESYGYDSKGNLITAKSASNQSGFTYDSKSNLAKAGAINGTSFEYAYSNNNLMTRAKNSEGVRYTFAYDSKGNPASSTAQHTAVSTALTPGRVYYLRLKNSGKYLDLSGGVDKDQAGIVQWDYNGGLNQRWKLLEAGEGYYKFSSMFSATGKVLDVTALSTANGTKLQLFSDHNGDNQKFKIKPLSGDYYQITAKIGSDKKAIGVGAQSVEAGAAIQITDQSESDIAQAWYFEPADEGAVSAAPEAGKTYNIRVRHSGQYLDVAGESKAVGTKVHQYYYHGDKNQQFTLEDAGDSYYYLTPVHAPGMVLCKAGISADGYSTITLQNKTAGDYKQQFKFVKSGFEYGIVCRDGNLGLDVARNLYAASTEIITTGQSADNFAANKKWILEECSERIDTSMTYTSDGRHMKSITDARGNVITNTYDSKNRLLTAVTDPNGKNTNYTYDPNTDMLLSVDKMAGDKQVKNTYTYENDRLKSITHNGFAYNFGYDNFGNSTTVAVGSQVLRNNQYLPGNGALSSTTYGNGAVLSNVYDKNYNVMEQKLNGTTISQNKYDDYGDLIEHVDLQNNVNYNYKYDLIDRLIGVNTSKGQALRIAYDKKDRIDYSVQRVNGSGVKVQYTYGEPAKQQKPGMVYGLKVDDVERVRYNYDALTRLNKRTLVLDGSSQYVSSYEYLAGAAAGTTTTMIKSLVNGADKLSYTYDKLGNIKTISENGVLKATYYYDELSQLTREDSTWENKTIQYTYDAGGNILNRKEYVYTTGTPGTATAEVKYVYGDTQWKDKLTSYNGEAITYDAIGNPLVYRDGMQMTWIKGKVLASLKKGSTNMAFGYDAGGNRVKKTVNGVTTDYYLNGSAVVTQITGNNRMDFVYDDEGQLMGCKYEGKLYYYIKNLQGDITGIIDNTGKQVVNYSYNSWGKMLQISGSGKDGIGVQNPFRYRGYYYDGETGLFYVSSRYYDPEIGRFINADDTDIIDGGNDHILENNLFAYCFNNPVNNVDNDGYWPKWATKVLIGVAIAALVVTVVATVVVTCGVATPGLALAGGGMLSGGFGFSAATVATAAAVMPVASGIAIGSTVAAAGSYYLSKSKSKSDPYARPDQKKQGRENKEKKKGDDKKWKGNPNKQKQPLKKHTPGKDHRMY